MTMRDLRLNLLLLTLLLLLALVVSPPLRAEDKPAVPVARPLSAEQSLALQSLQAEHRAATAEAEAARLRQENIQLRYILAITNYRAELGLDQTWDFNETTKSFSKRPEDKKASEKPPNPPVTASAPPIAPAKTP